MREKELQVQEKQMVQQDSETTKPEKYFIPAVDIFEDEEKVTVMAEMPGVKNTGVDVSLEDDVLTIRGNREEVTLEGRPLLQEYESGSYLRRFTVAETIDQDNIRAAMTNGLLKVELPKAAPAQPRKIEVQAG
ncbi:MAG TPA: Hsp20/alpha crystallin family protein [Desulfobulbaceae bacterium]|nr:Hsp20/alpha crystallin family protein [Desulfobulbaceae bacterium]